MMEPHPRVRLGHLDRMTDSTGLIQHAIYSIPRRESGYTIDDNARALRLCVRLWCDEPGDAMLGRLTTYLGLLEYARRPGGGFHNLMSYQRQWLATDASGDCQGQAVRALAAVLGSSLPEDYRLLARELIDATLPTLAELRSLRAQAYVVLAYGHLWRAGTKRMETVDKLEHVSWTAAQHLLDCYQRSRRPGWHWFEAQMTYANAVLPHALFVAAQRWPEAPFAEIARESFEFLDEQTVSDGIFRPVGNNGWYAHGEAKAEYDQQPVEAETMADAALSGLEFLGEARYRAAVARIHGWFHSRNSVGIALADPETGGCRDGLHPTGVNRNQGAESTLAYLWTCIHQRDAQAAGMAALKLSEYPQAVALRTS